jgi:hypothetical protein
MYIYEGIFGKIFNKRGFSQIYVNNFKLNGNVKLMAALAFLQLNKFQKKL